MKKTTPPIINAYQVNLDQSDIEFNSQAQLWGGEYPGSADQKQMEARMQRFHQAGFTHFINLTEVEERPDHYENILKQLAGKSDRPVSHQRFAIQDYGLPPAEQLNQILDQIDLALNDGQKVYVHCWGGIGRTGTVIGCWLVRHGLSAEEALDKIAQWRSEIPSAKYPSPETAEQRELIYSWSTIDPQHH